MTTEPSGAHAGGDPDREREQFDAIVAGLRADGFAAGAAPEPPETHDPIAELPAQWRVPSADSASILDQEEFVPPEPKPLPYGDLGFWGALAGLGGGLMWLFYLFFFDRYARPLWWALAFILALVGLVMVFLRQPDRRDDNWDDDVDGAVL